MTPPEQDHFGELGIISTMRKHSKRVAELLRDAMEESAPSFPADEAYWQRLEAEIFPNGDERSPTECR